MMEKKNDVIDLGRVVRKLWGNRRLFFKMLPVAFVVACALILCVPRYYVSYVSLAPEAEGGSSGGALGSLASSFGIDLGSLPSTDDAIQPLLYPELFESNDFVVSLLDIHVRNEEGDIDTDYFDYMANHQKQTLYMIPVKWVKRQLKKLTQKKEIMGGGVDGKIDPFRLSEKENAVVESVKESIKCSVDKQYFVITITVQDQDRLICATMADSVRVRLQNFITEYRTSKARIDVEYYQQLAEETRQEYQEALQRYSAFCDANRNTILQSYLSRRDDLENDMQLKFTTHNAMKTQLQSAQAKVQERTPAFTILHSATVPIKPAGPKRMLFVLGILILTSFGLGVYILRDDLAAPFK